jgi:enediyne biosynthesis protein E4
VGDWMPVTYFTNNKGKIENKTAIANSSGLWNCIAAADIDKDGDADFVLGNWGLNSQFKASPEKPMEMYVNDFDGNGSSEAIITYFWPDGKSHLYNSKSDITSQLPFLKKKFLQYKDYAGKSINDVFGAGLIDKSAKQAIQTLSSSVLINEGNGNLKLSPLPEMAQSSAVFTIIADDFDKDGNIDIFTGGNFWDIKPDIGRLDANAAGLLRGDGKGGFSFMPTGKSGLTVKGQIRDVTEISLKNNKVLVLARNNDNIIFLQTK